MVDDRKYENRFDQNREKRASFGLNEFAGYISVALIGFLAGYVAAAYGLKPYPFYLGFAVSLLGLVISLVLVKDTSRFTQLELQQEKDGQLKREQLKNQEEGHESSKIREESTVEKSEVISFLLIIVFLLRLAILHFSIYKKSDLLRLKD
jgi:dipeptide/tripeptide permease